MTFKLHSDLKRDCIEVCDLNVSKVLLRNCRQFPWLILVPMREGISEWFELSIEDQARSLAEVNWTANAVKAALKAKKMNIAALGNITPQLHIHVIARFAGDAAWPSPVWNVKPEPYAQKDMDAVLAKIKPALGVR
jgi:diadenosine tetraphosphate (Ap4A) HIT family hydrolase